jgi:hypothetical protein
MMLLIKTLSWPESNEMLIRTAADKSGWIESDEMLILITADISA